MNQGEYAVQVTDLTKSYGKLEVLKGITLKVKKGTMLALLGPNGAGKTTTVHILSTLLKPDGGEILVNGFDVVKDAQEVRRTIGLTGQYAAVDEYLSGRENLEMMGRLYHLSREYSKVRAQELLEQFDLVEASSRAVKTYSGGMRRRLDLAVSLIATPPIIFLDEPTTGLDPRSRIQMWEVIEKLKKDGATILLTTQYLEEADKLADQIAVIDHGKVIALGTADELKSQVGSDQIEVTLEQEKDFDTALAQIGNGVLYSSKEEKVIRITSDGSVAAIKKVLDAMYEAKINISAFSVHKPTLDDVFISLTGRQAEVAQA